MSTHQQTQIKEINEYVNEPISDPPIHLVDDAEPQRNEDTLEENGKMGEQQEGNRAEAGVYEADVELDSSTSRNDDIDEDVRPLTPDLMYSMSSSSSEKTSTQDEITPAKPLTLLEIYDMTQSPGCKRKRSITHLGSIAISSILPPATSTYPSSHCPTAEDGLNARSIGRPVVTRKKIGLGSLLKGMRMGGVEGCRGVDSDMRAVGDDAGSSEDDSESEDDDLIILMR